MDLSSVSVEWQTEYESALAAGREARKPLLLFFSKDGCLGCEKMAAVTFPDPTVGSLIKAHFVPVEVDIMTSGKLAHKYHAVWTPNFRVIDIQGSALYRSVGWLPPSEFAPFLLMGLGHYHFDRKRYTQAAEVFALLPDRYPRSGYLPECYFYLAVSRYMDSGDHDRLDAAWDDLYTRYPDSLWALRTRITAMAESNGKAG
jgi:thioredoxin-related protein